LHAQHDLRGIVDGLLATVLSAARVLSGVYGREVEARPGYRRPLRAGVLINAALGAFAIQSDLERLHASQSISATYGPTGSTHAGSGRLRGATATLRAGDPPADLAGFRALGRRRPRAVVIRTCWRMTQSGRRASASTCTRSPKIDTGPRRGCSGSRTS